ncbi:uncharacterized protein [Diadema setosum]|uniref:uncharacterized protein n=1 Tax=Diadema setosum TaxID=31175 RepID=UPI003B3AAA0A
MRDPSGRKLSLRDISDMAGQYNDFSDPSDAAVRYGTVKLTVPPGFQNIIRLISHEVLREQPKDSIKFIAGFLQDVLAIRESTGFDPCLHGELIARVQAQYAQIKSERASAGTKRPEPQDSSASGDSAPAAKKGTPEEGLPAPDTVAKRPETPPGQENEPTAAEAEPAATTPEPAAPAPEPAAPTPEETTPVENIPDATSVEPDLAEAASSADAPAAMEEDSAPTECLQKMRGYLPNHRVHHQKTLANQARHPRTQKSTQWSRKHGLAVLNL